MPELPEVQHATDSLAAQIVGHRFSHVVKLDWERMVETPSPALFKELLAGRLVQAARRRAKWILLELDADWTLALHLRMSGHITVEDAGTQPDRYVHLAIALDNGQLLMFHDTRKFGRARLLDPAGLAELDQAHGIEPLSAAFTVEYLQQLLATHARQLKPFLLDQSQIAGIGNIYADESLWRSQLHPLRNTASITADEALRLQQAIRAALEAGLHYGGSTLRDYRNAYGVKGTNQDHFYAYDREGHPCERCGTPIVRTLVGQRGTHYCPECQRPKAEG